ncbi:MAG: hypothetical protein GY865_11770 [candidate division Zixibacteria bacterium]|nr:hypothetical protein [candidate division Zixibacteria bacterium]
MCSKCDEYFQLSQCGKTIGSCECDCPKCQGLCTDDLESTGDTPECPEHGTMTWDEDNKSL